MDDRELVKRILRNDRAAAEALVHEYSSLIYTVFRREHDDPDHVEQSFMDFFARLAENDYRLLRSWNGECRLQTFLAAQALRMVIEARAGGTELECDLSRELLPPLRQSLQEALHTLSEADRRIIQLRRFDGLGFREIAMRLDMSADAAAVTLHRAEKRLRDQVSMTYPALFQDFVR
ncbi:MAG: sigma-70 family RNA polymerase sigma factor [Gammaproteobacteria bacterium]|nr:sigma-70 family RNA polymerase sigma factor [Gammaproteobacteria bacterium]